MNIPTTLLGICDYCRYAPAIWKMVQPFINKNTAKKIKIVSARDSRSTLEAAIDLCYIPTDLYGTSQIPCTSAPDGTITEEHKKMDDFISKNVQRKAAGQPT